MEDALKLICSMNNFPFAVFNYRNYGLAYKSSRYDDLFAKTVAKWGKRLQIQIKTNVFHSFDPISIIGFLTTFKLSHDTKRVHHGAAMELLPSS